MRPEAIASFSLEGRTALVTGGARGIGEAIAARLISQGAAVILADVVDAVDETAARLGARAVRLDVTDSAAVTAMADTLNGEAPVDILIANAGFAYEADSITHSDAQWRKAMAINLDGVFYCVRAFGAHMVRRRSGSIAAISSIAGVKAVRPELHAGYDVAKAGVAHMCRVIGVEWAPHNVRVNAVGPGYTETEMLKTAGIERPDVMAQWLSDIPMGRLLRPAEIAATVGFLASDAASGITAQLIMADAGYSTA